MNVTHTGLVASEASDSRTLIPARHFQWFIAAHAAFASIASLLLVSQGASEEPYARFRAAETLSQVGLGCILIAMWLYLISGILYGVATSRLARGWLALLLWAAIVLFYLHICPVGYVEDVTEWLAVRPAK